jgi:hypothetical protein
LLSEDTDKDLDRSVFAQQRDLLPAEFAPSERTPALEASAESAVELQTRNTGALVQALESERAAAPFEILRGRAALAEGRVIEAGEHFEAARAANDNLYICK